MNTQLARKWCESHPCPINSVSWLHSVPPSSASFFIRSTICAQIRKRENFLKPNCKLLSWKQLRKFSGDLTKKARRKSWIGTTKSFASFVVKEEKKINSKNRTCVTTLARTMKKNPQFWLHFCFTSFTYPVWWCQMHNETFCIWFVDSMPPQTASSKDHFFSKSTEDEKHSEGDFELTKKTNKKLSRSAHWLFARERWTKNNSLINDCAGGGRPRKFPRPSRAGLRQNRWKPARATHNH